MPQRPRRLLHRTCLSVGLALAGGAAPAATVIWGNPGPGDWFAEFNWQPLVVPGLGDVAYVNNGGTASAALPVSVGSLNVGVDDFSLSPTFRGTVEVGTAGMAIGGTMRVGASRTASVFAAGRVTVAGTLSTTAGGPFHVWEIATANGGEAEAEVQAAIVDTVATPLDRLRVGFATQGGHSVGALSATAGELRVADFVEVGRVIGNAGGSAEGSLDLGAASMRGAASDSTLTIGTVVDGAFDSVGSGHATGGLSARAVDGFASVRVGATAVHKALDVQANGTLDLSGGLLNASGGGTLAVGEAIGLSNNLTIVGAAQAMGRATVTGDVTGYGQVGVGTVFASGRADGGLDLTGGTLATGQLDIGRVVGSSGVNVVDGAAAAVGRVSVSGGALTVSGGPSPGVTVGGIFAPNPGVLTSALGELVLSDADVSAPTMSVGTGGGQGAVTATAGSRIDVSRLGLGLGAGSDGSMTLTDSRLRTVVADALGGDVTVGGGGGTARLDAERSAVELAGNLSIGGFTAAAGDGRMRLVDSTLAVAGSVGIGDFGPDSHAGLALEDSVASVDGSLFLGRSANAGTLFGDSLLAVDASELQIGNALTIDFGAELLFGIDGLTRGKGGYGAISTGVASLNSSLVVDFSDLVLDALSPELLSFDLITSGSATGIVGDFASVSFVNAPTGFSVRYGAVVDGTEIWRVTLQRDDRQGVPEPGTLALWLAAGAAGLASRRRRRPST